ncbi:MAG TPA: hypothetical protein PLU72_09315 [Candidatus Ozemobacteraceae bacterium]|nr:hypothetical protein [Candidatus Ozemobacteraceae bacterium]
MSLFLLGLLVFLFVRLPGVSIITLLHDDSFFYLKTAANIADGKGSTFDGINITNGYHPLYMAFLSAVSAVFPIKGLGGIYMVMFIDIILFACFLLIADRLYQRLGLSDVFRLPLGLAYILFMGINDFGLESRLVLVIAWAFLAEIYSLLYEHQRANWRLAAILSVLLFLSRIDLALLLGFVILTPLAMSCGQAASSRFQEGMGVLAVSVAGMGCYFLGNTYLFSAPTTVSSYLKMGWPGMLETGWTDLGGSGVRIRLLFCLIASGLYFGLSLRAWWVSRLVAEKEAGMNLFFAALNGYVLFYMIILICFAKGVGGWYFLCPISIVLFSTVGVFSRQWVKHTRIKAVFHHETFLLVVSLLLMVSSGLYAIKKTVNTQHDVLAISGWLRQNISEQTPIFQVDASGKTGYLSERCVVNGDGLINSWEYINCLKAGGLREYLQKYHIEYFLLSEYEGGDKLSVIIPGWKYPPKLIQFSNNAQRIQREGRFLLIRDHPEQITVKSL